MTRHLLAGQTLLATAFALPTLASAAQLPTERRLIDIDKVAGSIETDYLSYSDGRGHRWVSTVHGRYKLGTSKLALSLSQGSRDFGASKVHSTRVAGTFTKDWTSRLSSSTSLGFATNRPVFTTREAAQDLSYKFGKGTVGTVGGRYAHYYGGVDSWSWSLGAAQYFRGGFVSYRFTDYDTQGLGNSVAHRLTGKIYDRLGSTQLAFDRATALNSAANSDVPIKGKFTQIEVQRLIGLGGDVSLSVAARRNWNDAGNSKYRGTGLRLGLVFGR